MLKINHVNKDEIIRSGLIEQYASGLLSQEEEQEMEQYFRKWPDLRQHVMEMQEMLEEVGGEYDLLAQQDDHTKARVVRMHRKTRNMEQSSNWKKLLVALGFLVFFFGGTALYFFQKNKIAAADINAMERSLQELRTNLDSNQENIKQLSDNYEFFIAPQTVRIRMKPLKPDFVANAIAYYNPKTQAAYLNVIDFPAPPIGKKYQIWADVADEMINMGQLDIGKSKLVTLPFIADATAFNITIEPQQGSETPTFEALMMNGEIGF